MCAHVRRRQTSVFVCVCTCIAHTEHIRGRGTTQTLVGWRMADLFIVTRSGMLSAQKHTHTRPLARAHSRKHIIISNHVDLAGGFWCTGHTHKRARWTPAPHAHTHARTSSVCAPVATHYIIVIYNIAARLVRGMFVYAIHIILYLFDWCAGTAKGYGSVHINTHTHSLGGT